MTLKAPGGLAEHETKYHDDAWKRWTPAELGNAAAFFLKRADHRLDPAKREKDLTDAQNYLDMLQAHIDDAKGRSA